MLVQDWMTPTPITLGVKSSVVEAAEVMRAQNIRQFPVVTEDGKLIGIVSDRDIRDAMPSKYLSGDNVQSGEGLLSLTAEDIMTYDPITVSALTPVDITADIIQKNKVGALPVVDAEMKLIGIISEVDILRFFSSCSGVARGGLQIAFKLEAKPGPLAALLDDLRSESVSFSSTMTSYDLVEPGFRMALIRFADTGPHTNESLIKFLKNKHEIIHVFENGVLKAI
ncbi:MAG: CBS and ACT domain-containing protein [Desulfovibrio sp.]